jgi:hypothetical protein
MLDGIEGMGWDCVPEPFDSDLIRDHLIALKKAFYGQLHHFITVTQDMR